MSDREKDSLDDFFFCEFQSSDIVPTYFNQVLGLLLFDEFFYLFDNIIEMEIYYSFAMKGHKLLKDLPSKLIVIKIDDFVSLRVLPT